MKFLVLQQTKVSNYYETSKKEYIFARLKSIFWLNIN